MSSAEGAVSRAQYHAAHHARAEALARDWIAQREVLQGAWLDWVAGQLYQLNPPEYAAMVRRQLQQLAG
ncbi:hypothetical protein [Pseudomonas aegrilactucae]|uniref:Uncharacterized protein n=1 Tax=Pseudomonas aegrilactucae TaxID=2854028 RepID=A0A9Q3ADT9_9PSED|nr:hypothetical protein [Pseudomonas aegrilactucae]